ncbi:MAG: 5'/3'-nucleotidase SurE [Syntrophorhabdaceae bacterium]|nr:5'/3'-nucleotidase SurE [Syntrophorhabdaceae bacterium]
MLILLTNDDGIHSKGIVTLGRHLSAQHEVYMVAPERERTCVAHAVTLHKPLRIRQVSHRAYGTNGTPADCVLLGISVVLPRRPDFVVSGINTGPNMGQDVNYSGTVAAARQGAFLGIPSMAVSVCAREGFLFDDAAAVACAAIKTLTEGVFPESTVVNINIPNVPRENLRGFSVTRLGKRIYNDIVHERVDPRGGKYYWIGGNGEKYERKRGTDFYAVERGFVSVTPLGLDITDTGSMKLYQKHFRRLL